VELPSFVASLGALDLAEIRAIAADLDQLVATVADEIDTTRAIIAVEQAVRAARCSQAAAVAGQQASRTVLRAAELDGARASDPDVVRVARAAGQIARGIVAGPSARLPVRHLALGFRRLGAPALV
jgi:hypothetical protein